MVIMVSRLKVLQFLSASALALVLAGCGAPLSATWQGFPPDATGQADGKDTPRADAGPDCAQVKCVALTFDDGPGPHTESLLDILDEHEAKATFFLIGKDVVKFPDIVRDEAARGHEIGNHTWSHQDLAKISVAAGQRELSKTDAAIKEVTGAAPTVMRPPYGTIREDHMKSLDLPVAMWSVDTFDWKTRDAKKTVKAAEKVVPGSIVLMHDIHPSTIEAMPKMLTDLKARGFHFVTVSQLVGDPKPGTDYKTGRQAAAGN